MKKLNSVIYNRSFADCTENLIPAPKCFPFKEFGVMIVCSGIVIELANTVCMKY